MMTDDPQGSFAFSYFADAFLYNPDTNMFQHVLTKGYPTYRALGTCATDLDTGTMYMFGGFTNPEYVPSRPSAKPFSDLWKLRLDMPGGGWEGVDVDEEARTAKVGPWSRCYSCGSAGPWRKCGGA